MTIDQTQNYISSDGGPFVGIALSQAKTWQGVDGSSVPSTDTDYARACQVSAYTGSVEVADGMALILSAPFDTYVSSAFGNPVLVQVEASEAGFHPPAMIGALARSLFAQADCVTEISFNCSALALFDAGGSGADMLDERLVFDICPGAYRILTKACETRDVRFLCHLFDPV